jgi:cytoskeletal protein RodZ
MNSIGERLRQERLRQGLDLNQIGELTKIGSLMLEAIEADDFDKLPGSFFARSFVRQYARALGLDEEEFETELMRVAGFGHPASEQSQAGVPEIVLRPEPMPAARSGTNRHPLGSLIAFVLILAACSAIYTLWQKTRATAAKSQQSLIASQTPTPAPEATPSPSPAATPTATPVEAPVEEPTATLPPEAAAEPPAVVAPKPERPHPAPSAAEPAGIHLELRATSQAWVRVVSDGKTVYSGVLQPNEARVFEGNTLVTLRAGNAAALAATFNGKPLGELGPEGQVRTIQFTPSGFEVIAPADQP